MAFLGLDHVDLRVPSLAAVESFYDALMPALGLPMKTYSFVDASGEWHASSASDAYNTVEFHEAHVPGEAPRFFGIIEDSAMVPTLTRIAFRLSAKDEVERWRERLVELGARDIETENDFDAYPALFFCDPVGTRLEICARKAKT